MPADSPRVRRETQLLVDRDRFFLYDPADGYLFEEQPLTGFPTYGSAKHWQLLGDNMGLDVCEGREVARAT